LCWAPDRSAEDSHDRKISSVQHVPSHARREPRALSRGALLIAATSVAVFWRTAYPTITWWDSGNYSLAAYTLGVTSPPGSLLLTLLGWPIARLPLWSSPAHLLNLSAGLLAALAVVLVYGLALQIQRIARGDDESAAPGAAPAIGAALGALAFAFSDTLWEHAIKFTPYVLTAVFTGLILWTMLRWWEDAERPDSWRWIALLGFLFGLDFSVHRTNALLLPGALVWILIRHAATLRRLRALLGGACGLVIGLSVQLLIIPIAAYTQSPLNFTEPGNWSRFWYYISLEQLGGHFLFSLYPRNAHFWSVQVADLAHTLGANFLHWNGPASVLGVLPAVAAVVGLRAVWQRNRRLGGAFALVLFLQAASTVIYFNIPANFFRPFDRHYLPICVTIAVLLACGLSAAMTRAAGLARSRRWIVAGPLVALVLVVPATQLVENWNAHDASGRYFARDFAFNALEGLPPNAIYFTIGDNDTYSVMYLQAVEGVRQDVTIMNLSLANFPLYPDQFRRRDPSFPLAIASDERSAMIDRPWTDTTLVLKVEGTAEQLGFARGTPLPAAVTLRLRPSSGTRMNRSEIAVLDILQTNRWKRPLCFAVTVSKSGMEWLAPFGRLDGLFWRVVPVAGAPADPDLLHANMLDHAQYRGYAETSVRIDGVSRNMGVAYYAALTTLLEAERARGALDQCRVAATQILELLPPERLDMSPTRASINSACGPRP
jgi:hypothetical protein